MAGIRRREDHSLPFSAPFSAATLHPVQTLIPSFHGAKRHGVEVTAYISKADPSVCQSSLLVI